MSEVFRSQSAKIYDFPARGRFALADRGNESTAATDVLRIAGSGIMSSGGWYHDAAIQEAEHGRNTGSPSRKS